MTIKEQADAMQAYMTEIRHDLHKHPELSLHEYRTTDLIAHELEKEGIKYTRFDPTGLMCEIKGNKPGNKCIGLRADIDALPLQETADVPYKSVVEGVMHACGHDQHTVMLLGAAKILNSRRDEFGGTARCIFQPAEEGMGGADLIIKQGAADGCEEFLGMHVWPNYIGTGEIGAYDIMRTAGAIHFRVKVKGRICHGQAPHLGIDSLMIASQMITALQTIISRRMPPLEAVVVSIGKINAGTASNIVAEETTFEGTIHYHVKELGEQACSLLRQICTEVALAFGGSAQVDIDIGVPPMVNDENLSKVAWRLADKICGGKAPCLHMGDIMGGEDFTAFQNRAPGVYVMTGCGGNAMGHQGDFVAEDGSLPYGAALYAEFAIDRLNQ